MVETISIEINNKGVIQWDKEHNKAHKAAIIHRAVRDKIQDRDSKAKARNRLRAKAPSSKRVISKETAIVIKRRKIRTVPAPASRKRAIHNAALSN